jgi:hypothetical protein
MDRNLPNICNTFMLILVYGWVCINERNLKEVSLFGEVRSGLLVGQVSAATSVSEQLSRYCSYWHGCWCHVLTELYKTVSDCLRNVFEDFLVCDIGSFHELWQTPLACRWPNSTTFVLLDVRSIISKWDKRDWMIKMWHVTNVTASWNYWSSLIWLVNIQITYKVFSFCVDMFGIS